MPSTARCSTRTGLNDGGVTRPDCPEHAGLHIDTERSILEVVDQENRQLVEGEGTILATSLYNYANALHQVLNRR